MDDHQTLVAKRFIKAIQYVIAEDLPGISNVSELADTIGAKQSNLSAIKTGKRYPTVEMLCNLCVKYNVNPSYLLIGNGDVFLSKPKK